MCDDRGGLLAESACQCQCHANQPTPAQSPLWPVSGSVCQVVPGKEGQVWDGDCVSPVLDSRVETDAGD